MQFGDRFHSFNAEVTYIGWFRFPAPVTGVPNGPGPAAPPSEVSVGIGFYEAAGRRALAVVGAEGGGALPWGRISVFAGAVSEALSTWEFVLHHDLADAQVFDGSNMLARDLFVDTGRRVSYGFVVPVAGTTRGAVFRLADEVVAKMIERGERQVEALSS